MVCRSVGCPAVNPGPEASRYPLRSTSVLLGLWISIHSPSRSSPDGFDMNSVMIRLVPAVWLKRAAGAVMGSVPVSVHATRTGAGARAGARGGGVGPIVGGGGAGGGEFQCAPGE